MENVLFQFWHIGERNQTVADISGRHNVDVVADDTAAAAVIGDRDNGRDVRIVVLQFLQNDRQARSAADNDDFLRSARILTHDRFTVSLRLFRSRWVVFT
ncbi:hypothetical protein SDC9_129726 [bioreactor metagenome]|uniref:Uncharacterized protein n=1 Tax=bioreactor metagenome TaxID=1076179 RepID=A0A645D0C5_9ZZZZ